jgi:hypothetical protein
MLVFDSSESLISCLTKPYSPGEFYDLNMEIDTLEIYTDELIHKKETESDSLMMFWLPEERQVAMALVNDLQ